MKRLNVAIAGCGWVGGLQVEQGFAALPDLFAVSTCCDTDGDRAMAFAARYGVPRVAPDYTALLALADVDVVSVCTPPSAHYGMVMEALAAGRHAICEKPLTSSLALADDLIAAETRSSSRVMPIFQYRFGPGLAPIRHLVRSRLLGKAYVASVETAWRRGSDYYAVPWRGRFATELGGVLLTQSIHIHDLFLDLMGAPAEVAAFRATRVNPIEVEDCAVASLRMPDGSLASLTATLGSMRPLTRLRFCFERATIEWQGYDREAIRPADGRWSVTPADDEAGRAIDACLAEARPVGSGFAGQFALFHEALATGAPFPVTLADARRALELVTAIFHASGTGTVVKLPIGAGHPAYRGWAPVPAATGA